MVVVGVVVVVAVVVVVVVGGSSSSSSRGLFCSLIRKTREAFGSSSIIFLASAPPCLLP